VHEPITLGIHVGHHTSCALVVGDKLAAGVQKERISGRKHDSIEYLDNSIPVQECLNIAGVKLVNIDHIVTSFQALSPGGFGLHRPLAGADFNLFELYDPRHTVISHHLAHAHCTAGTSGFSDAAVLVSDLAGSSTYDGMDFALPFSEFFGLISGAKYAREVKTECLSLYNYSSGQCRLLDREYCIPHNAPESLIQSAASLYDNVSRFVFRSEHAHGQLMALAAHYKSASCTRPLRLVTRHGDRITFHNDWQHTLEWGHPPEKYAWLAHEAQRALECILLTYVSRLRKVSQHRRLALAGGVFLNILANSKIAEQSGFAEVYVPSAPHDAGISIGCAFYGSRVLSSQPVLRRQGTTDRISRSFCAADELRSLPRLLDGLLRSRVSSAQEVAQRLANGEIIARFSGPAEFGPRALGGRSILGSPLLSQTKDRLNEAKGRQSWRPVAPCVLSSEFRRFFLGPYPAPYMTFAHSIQPQYVAALLALSHPDGTTRVQTLDNDDDPWLAQLLIDFGKATGYPILVNTSLNGRGRPMIYWPIDAIRFFMLTDSVDHLLLDNILVSRVPSLSEQISNIQVAIAPGTLFTQVNGLEAKRYIVTRSQFSQQVTQATWTILQSMNGSLFCLSEMLALSDRPTFRDIYQMVVSGMIEESGNGR